MQSNVEKYKVKENEINVKYKGFMELIKKSIV